MGKRVMLEDAPPQGELPEMPASSPLGKACRAYRKAVEKMDAAVEALKEEKGETKQTVVEILKESGKDSVTVDGYTYCLRHIEESDELVIKKPRVK